MDARTRRKNKRASQRYVVEQGLDPETVWYSTGPVKKEKPRKLIPGKDFYEETSEEKAKHDGNNWDNNLEEVIAFIKEATRDDIWDDNGDLLPGRTNWSWARNMDCKYVNIRIDMRDGGFVLVNKEGQRISLNALKWQYKSEYDNE